MTGYLLDTDMCIYALKRRAPVLAHLLSHPPSAIFVSVISEAELRTGAAKSTSPIKTLRKLESFLRPLRILPFESDDAKAYAKVRARLESLGTPIGPLDTFIGAHALARGLTLVTNNEGELRRVPGLKVENWAE